MNNQDIYLEIWEDGWIHPEQNSTHTKYRREGTVPVLPGERWTCLLQGIIDWLINFYFLPIRTDKPLILGSRGNLLKLTFRYIIYNSTNGFT